MKKNIIAIVIFLACILLPPLTWPAVDSVINVEINENRPLKEFPEFSDGFITEFEEYFIDHAPYRAVSITINSEIDRFFNKIYSSIVTAVGGELYNSKNNVLFGEDGWLFYLGDDSLKYYTGENLPSDEELRSYLEKITLVSDFFRGQGKEFVILVPPNKENVYPEYMPTGIKTMNNQKRLEIINDYITEKSDADFIYPLELFSEKKKTRTIYYQHDTHWNKAGSALGVCEILRAIGIDYNEYELLEIEYTGGDLANMIAQNPEKSIDYAITYANVENYATDKNLMIFGDSFSVGAEDMISMFFKDTHREHYFDFDAAKSPQHVDDADVIAVISVERYHEHIFGDGGLLDKIIDVYNLK